MAAPGINGGHNDNEGMIIPTLFYHHRLASANFVSNHWQSFGTVQFARFWKVIRYLMYTVNHTLSLSVTTPPSVVVHLTTAEVKGTRASGSVGSTPSPQGKLTLGREHQPNSDRHDAFDEITVPAPKSKLRPDKETHWE